jgi:hypothetical protein
VKVARERPVYLVSSVHMLAAQPESAALTRNVGAWRRVTVAKLEMPARIAIVSVLMLALSTSGRTAEVPATEPPPEGRRVETPTDAVPVSAPAAPAADASFPDTTRYELNPWNSGYGEAMEPVAMNLMSAAWAVSQLEDGITDRRLFAKPGEKYRYDRLLGRVARLTVVDIWVLRWLSTYHHERSGHTGRGREFGAEAGRIRVPGFWTAGGGNSVDSASLSDYQFCIEKVGGTESDTVWAEETLRRTLSQPRAWYSDLLYVGLKVDLPLYILGGDTPRPGSPNWERKRTEGWDIAAYLDRFQGHADRSVERLYDESRRGAVWSLLDPRLTASLYGYFVGYLGQGKRQVQVPMLRAGGAAWLPGTGFHLSPMGPEYYLFLHARRGPRLLTLSGRRSIAHRNGSGYGFGIDGRRIVEHRLLSLDAAADFWRQPVDVTRDPVTAEAGPAKSGGNLEVRLVSPRLSDRWRVGLVGKLGYKTGGFLMGRPLAAGWYGHVGVALHP